MEDGKIKNIIIVVLILVIVGLVGYIINSKVIQTSGNSNSEDCRNGSIDINNSVNNNSNLEGSIQEKLEKIVSNELYILNRKNSLSEISNNDKLSLAFDMLEYEYTVKSNDINTLIENFSVKKLEQLFNTSSIADLGISHQSYDAYELINDTYNNTLGMSKRSYNYDRAVVYKTINFSEEDGKYILSMVKILNVGQLGDMNYVGSLEIHGKRSTNVVIDEMPNYDDIVEYAQSYLDTHYEEMKDMFDVYNYVFEKNDNKFNLVEYYVD